MRRCQGAGEIARAQARLTEIMRRHNWQPEYQSAMDFIEEAYHLTLDPWQLNYIVQAPRQRRIAICASRQSGKSFITKAFGAHCMLYIPKFFILVASRSLRQASHFIAGIMEGLTTRVKRKDFIFANRMSLCLPNLSQIIAIPAMTPDAGRGFSPDLILLDEAAFASEELLAAISPSVAATNGAIHMLSSANGPQGFFHAAFEGATKDVYWTLRVPYNECPRITEEFIAEERISLGDVRFRSEYNCEFLSPEGAFFNYEAIRQFAELDPMDGFDDEPMAPEQALEVGLNDIKEAMDFYERNMTLLYD